MYQKITGNSAKLIQTDNGQAFISVKRNRVKTVNSLIRDVYLQDGQEFEIELFNPSTKTKLARIQINGNAISSSDIVLKPGQRIYLERYIDSSEKFLFQTYSVDNTPEVKEAIRHNGDIQIDFYNEYEEPKVYYSNNFSYSFNDPQRYRRLAADHYYDKAFPYSSSDVILGNKTNINSLNTQSYFCNTDSISSFSESSTPINSSLETGRVEKGSESSQSFKDYYGKFNSYISNTVRIKIFPLSQKPLEAKNLAQYCTNCGTKNKKGWKYCPTCGNKY